MLFVFVLENVSNEQISLLQRELEDTRECIQQERKVIENLFAINSECPCMLPAAVFRYHFHLQKQQKQKQEQATEIIEEEIDRLQRELKEAHEILQQEKEQRQHQEEINNLLLSKSKSLFESPIAAFRKLRHQQQQNYL